MAAWIELHLEILEHPKTLRVAGELNWNKFETVGRLVAFWRWIMNYAPTGDLRKYNNAQLGQAVELNGEDATRFGNGMVASSWIDRSEGIFRVHDWPLYCRQYLKDSKFKRQPQKWGEVLAIYPDLMSADCPQTVGGLSSVPTNHTNPPTKPAAQRVKERLLEAEKGGGRGSF